MKQLMIGIAGGSASGKSTFLHALLSTITASNPTLKVNSINTDRYFHCDFSRIPKFFSPSFQCELPDFNHPDALDISQLLADIKSLCSAERQPDVLLIEGHLLFHFAEVRNLFDIRIFIELDGEIRALRRMVRNLEHPGDPIPDHSAQSIASYYLESAREGYLNFIAPTKQYADLILRGDADFSRIANILNAMIQGMMQSAADPDTNR